MPATHRSEARTDNWQAHIEDWKASGQSQRAYCTTHDLNYARFGYWVRKFRQQAGSSSSGFVRVTPTIRPASKGLSLVLPNGLELRGIDAGNLSVVEQLLNRLS